MLKGNYVIYPQNPNIYTPSFFHIHGLLPSHSNPNPLAPESGDGELLRRYGGAASSPFFSSLF